MIVTLLGEPVRGTSLLINSGFGSGVAFAGSNLGTGFGLYQSVANGILAFKSLTSGSGVTLTNNTDDINISVPSSYITAIINSGYITGIVDSTYITGIITSSYINTNATAKVNKAGDSMSGALVNSSTGEFAGGIRTLSSGAYLIKKIVSIGSWDMHFSGGSGVDNKNVAHGLGANFNKIRSISVMIIDNAGTIIRPLPTIDGVTNDLVGGIGNIDSTNIVLLAVGASSINYNNTNYNGSANRGWVTIEYEA